MQSQSICNAFFGSFACLCFLHFILVAVYHSDNSLCISHVHDFWIVTDLHAIFLVSTYNLTVKSSLLKPFFLLLSTLQILYNPYFMIRVSNMGQINQEFTELIVFLQYLLHIQHLIFSHNAITVVRQNISMYLPLNFFLGWDMTDSIKTRVHIKIKGRICIRKFYYYK